MIPNLHVLIENGMSGLFTLPTRKTPTTIDWLDEDGLEVDLSDPVWESPNLTMSMHVAPGAEQEFNELMLSAFVPIRFPNSFRVLKLRYLAASNLKYRGGYHRKAPKWATLDIELANDEPLQLLKDVAPAPRPARFVSLVKLEGSDLSELGVVVAEVYNTASLTHALKDMGVHESLYSTGRTLLKEKGAEPHKQARQIALRCSIGYDSTDELLGVLAALWAVVGKSTALTMETAAQNIKCYYQSMTEVVYTEKRLKFTLNFQEI